MSKSKNTTLIPMADYLTDIEKHPAVSRLIYPEIR